MLKLEPRRFDAERRQDGVLCVNTHTSLLPFSSSPSVLVFGLLILPISSSSSPNLEKQDGDQERTKQERRNKNEHEQEASTILWPEHYCTRRDAPVFLSETLHLCVAVYFEEPGSAAPGCGGATDLCSVGSISETPADGFDRLTV